MSTLVLGRARSFHPEFRQEGRENMYILDAIDVGLGGGGGSNAGG